MQDNFFSFIKYFNNQAKELADHQTKMKKKIQKSGKTEEQLLQQPDWERELKIFMDADLNKKAWAGLYRIDTMETDSGITAVYLATDSAVQIKRAAVLSSGNQVQSIEINGRFTNFYYESAWNLYYRPDSGYHITGDQAILFGKRNSYEIDVQFVH